MEFSTLSQSGRTANVLLHFGGKLICKLSMRQVSWHFIFSGCISHKSASVDAFTLNSNCRAPSPERAIEKPAALVRNEFELVQTGTCPPRGRRVVRRCQKRKQRRGKTPRYGVLVLSLLLLLLRVFLLADFEFGRGSVVRDMARRYCVVCGANDVSRVDGTTPFGRLLDALAETSTHPGTFGLCN